MATAVFVPSLPAEVIHAGFGEWNAPKRFFRRRIFNSDLPCARCANSAYPSHDKTAFGLAVGHSDSLANLDLRDYRNDLRPNQRPFCRAMGRRYWHTARRANRN